MNKQELIDKAVHEFGGKWPARDRNNVYMSHRPENKGTTFYPFYVTDNNYGDYLYWSISEFQQRARELGYVNGYRWGVEYPTNGKKPDLPDGLLVKWVDRVTSSEAKSDIMDWDGVLSFRITDLRYKPSDTSYLDTPALEPVPDSDLPSVSIAISDAMNAAVSSGMIDIAKRLQEINKDVLAEANKRKAEAEKKRVVDAAYTFYDQHEGSMLEGFYALYDAGYLKLSAE